MFVCSGHRLTVLLEDASPVAGEGIVRADELTIGFEAEVGEVLVWVAAGARGLRVGLGGEVTQLSSSSRGKGAWRG